MAVLGVCLVLAATAGPAVFVRGEHFTLAWTHSIERVRWEEDYVVQPGAQPSSAPVLLAVAARVRGSAAGMEPPDGARLVDGWYEYAPSIGRPGRLRLTRSEFTPDYDRCVQGVCESLARWLPSDGGVTVLQACERP